MKSSVFRGLLVLAVSCAIIAQAQAQGCTCGNLGSGINPCTCSDVVVKAAKLPKPAYFVPPEKIVEAAAPRASIVTPPSAPSCGCSGSSSTSNSVATNSASSNAHNTETAYSSPVLVESSKSNQVVIKTANCNACKSATAYSSPVLVESSNSNPVVIKTANSNACNSATASNNRVVIKAGNSNAYNRPTAYGSPILIDSGNSNTYSGTIALNNPVVIKSGNPNAYTGAIAYTTVTTYNSNAAPCNSAANSGSATYVVPASPVLKESVIAVTNADTPAETASSGCGCDKKEELESLDLDDSSSSKGVIAPSFPPIGDLCYPLPINPRSGKFIEKAIVTPAYPGKIQCNTCDAPVPYVVCVNTQTGETVSRTLLSELSTDSGKITATQYANNGPLLKTLSGPKLTTLNTGSISGSTTGIFGSSTGSYSSYSSSGTLGQSRSELFPASSSYNRPSFGTFGQPPLAYAGSNGPRQSSGVTQYSSSSSDCFDDDTDAAEVDYSVPQMPADAVSLTLAYKNLRTPNVIYRKGKQFVPEDKLSFGHRTVPNEVTITKKIVDVPEEKLVLVDKPVVELKVAPPRTVVVGSYDQREEAKLAELEAIERESMTQEERNEQVSDGLLTYKDLGYAPVGANIAQSRSYDGIINGEINDSGEAPCGPLGPPRPDYVLGRVIVQRQAVDDYSDPSSTEIVNENI